MNENIRILPHVCQNEKCRELIMPPFSEDLIIYDFRKDRFLKVCKKCKKEDGERLRELHII